MIRQLTYLFGNAMFKRVVYGVLPRSHLGGKLALLLLLPFASQMSIALLGSLTTLVMVAVAVSESVGRRRHAGHTAHTAHTAH